MRTVPRAWLENEAGKVDDLNTVWDWGYDDSKTLIAAKRGGVEHIRIRRDVAQGLSNHLGGGFAFDKAIAAYDTHIFTLQGEALLRSVQLYYNDILALQVSLWQSTQAPDSALVLSLLWLVNDTGCRPPAWVIETFIQDCEDAI